jgi:hypothetical protein
MKTLKDLFEIVALAVESNQKRTHDFFIDYSGHVNQLRVRYYFSGWSLKTEPVAVDFNLDEDGIQAAYWFIKTKIA